MGSALLRSLTGEGTANRERMDATMSAHGDGLIRTRTAARAGERASHTAREDSAASYQVVTGRPTSAAADGAAGVAGTTFRVGTVPTELIPRGALSSS